MGEKGKSVKSLEFSCRSDYQDWLESLKRREKVIFFSSGLDELSGEFKVRIETDKRVYVVKYRLSLTDVFPEFESDKELFEILSDIASSSREKVSYSGESTDAVVLIEKLMNLINQFKFIYNINPSTMSELKAKILIGLLVALEESFYTWVKEMEDQIKGALLANKIRKLKSENREKRDH